MFIDEIQNSAAAVAILRYFYEKANDIYVIFAGSLLQTLLDYHISFPVGRVEYLFMHQMTFEEFLSAINENEVFLALKNLPIKKHAIINC